MSRSIPLLLFLYGPPAVGKLTVARAVAKRREFRVLHNHVTLDAVAEVLDFGTPAFWEAVGRLREDLIQSAARERLDLIFTYVFAPGDEPHVARVVDAFERNGGNVALVQLIASQEDLLRRVTDEGRKSHGKITDARVLRTVLDAYDVFQPIEGRSTLTVDVGQISVQEAANRIVEYVDSQAADDMPTPKEDVS